MKESLLILSGWAVDNFVWNPIIDFLSQDFQTFIVDWDGVLSPGEFKYRVMDLLREKGINNFSLIGWSLGSLVALDIAKNCSSKLNNLILFSPTARFIQDEKSNYSRGWHKRVVERMIDMLIKHPQRTLNNFYGNLFSDSEVKNGYYETFLRDLDKVRKEQEIQSLSLGLEYLIHKDIRRDIKEIDISALLIHGDRDMICPVEAGEYIGDNLRKSKLMLLKETGHVPFYTNPDQCYKYIKNYISNKEG